MDLYIQQPGAKLRYQGGQIQVHKEGQLLERFPAESVDRVWLYGPVQLTSAVLSFLLERGIATLFLTTDGWLKGELVGEQSAQA